MKTTLYLAITTVFCTSFTIVSMNDQHGERKTRMLDALMQLQYNEGKNNRTPKKGFANRSRSLRGSGKEQRDERAEINDCMYEKLRTLKS